MINVPIESLGGQKILEGRPWGGEKTQQNTYWDGKLWENNMC